MKTPPSLVRVAVVLRFPPDLLLEVDKFTVVQSAKAATSLSRSSAIFTLIEQGLERVGAVAPKEKKGTRR